MDNLNITYPDGPFRLRGIQEMNQRVQRMVDVLTLMRKWSNNQSVDHSPQCVVVVTISIISTTCLVHPISSLYAYMYMYMFAMLRPFMTGVANQSGDIDSSRASALTLGFQKFNECPLWHLLFLWQCFCYIVFFIDWKTNRQSQGKLIVTYSLNQHRTQ